MAVGIGDKAPEFSLPGTSGRLYSLAEYAGSPVVLAFYPGDNTPVCTKQLCSYNDNLSTFESVGAQVLAISPQSVDSHEGFSTKQGGFKFPLLADEDKKVFGLYGCLGPLGFARRSAFVIDGSGIIRYVHRAVAGLTFRPTDELIEAIRNAK